MSGPRDHSPVQEAPSCESMPGSDGVMRQTLKVTDLRDGFAYLEGDRNSACSACAAKTGCGAGALSEMVGGKQTLRLPHAMPLAVGDAVTVAMEPRAFLGAAVRAYLVPPAALVGAAGLAVSFGLGDAATAALCLPVLALSFVPLIRAERHARTHEALWIDGLVKP